MSSPLPALSCPLGGLRFPPAYSCCGASFIIASLADIAVKIGPAILGTMTLFACEVILINPTH